MPEVLSDRLIKKTRKAHRCHGCLTTIPVGSMAHASTNVDNGEIYTLYFCEDCNS